MRRVKTLPHSVIEDDRLSALGMIFIHWEISIEYDKDIKKWAGKIKQGLLLC